MTYDEIMENLPKTNMSAEDGRKWLANKILDDSNNQAGNLAGIDCELCKNKGVVYYLDENLMLCCRECGCMNERRIEFMREKTGLNKNFAKKTFDDFIVTEDWQRKMKRFAVNYAEKGINHGRSFYIGGQVGCGKTLICAGIVNSLISSCREVLYISWRTTIGNLKAMVRDDNYVMQRQKEIKKIQNADVLYIDDLFKVDTSSKPTSSDINTTFDIINARYNAGLPTIFSSELSILDIIEIDQALGSRIMQMTDGYQIQIGKDIRKNQRFKSEQ